MVKDSKRKSENLTNLRVILLIVTFLVVGIAGYVASLYARGYRFNSQTGNVTPNGLLVIKSDPDGAQIILDGTLKTLTNANIPLPPKEYDVSVSKEGYTTWSKRILIEKEVVTEVTAQLFSSAPSLSAITFSQTAGVTPSKDLSKIAYIVPTSLDNGSEEKSGLWVLENLNLPLGFSREPRRITDGNVVDSEILWSPDSREILLTLESGNAAYLLPISEETTQAQRVNVINRKEAILVDWQEEELKKKASQISKLPGAVTDVLSRKSSAVLFSPDEEMVMYSASSSASLPSHLIKELPGSSTQKEERDIIVDQTYVYDIKEDRNFLVYTDSNDLAIEGGETSEAKTRVSWFPNSRNLIIAEPEGIFIMDYDGTNKKSVYSGAYVSPHAYPTLSFDRLIILTNLGSTSNPPYLYFLSIK